MEHNDPGEIALVHEVQPAAGTEPTTVAVKPSPGILAEVLAGRRAERKRQVAATRHRRRGG